MRTAQNIPRVWQEETFRKALALEANTHPMQIIMVACDTVITRAREREMARDGSRLHACTVRIAAHLMRTPVTARVRECTTLVAQAASIDIELGPNGEICTKEAGDWNGHRETIIEELTCVRPLPLDFPCYATRTLPPLLAGREPVTRARDARVTRSVADGRLPRRHGEGGGEKAT